MKLRLASNLQLDDLELLILLLLPLECQDYWLGRHHHSWFMQYWLFEPQRFAHAKD